ncbi:MAG TPA: DNA uptake protein [Cyanobacteria bacterium UBA11149]|nr:DNA uptake protein [Cyanobacteria bacterium UBA11367]HBE59512.1 DNA uptake protein [Cyanobacteria bacterium UBA11366]HBK66526.1 DNA uptake protein [Cyanobacteria bacterium UBA11166]HBR77079.1 DNA uptake protein [Cyanobacteria bacterium UBA11159]HBS68209.1 DNA uptake protein [Cyanobacteria bacterium UBA11153]HBW90353.1 DNA uptake protein [Cyanobacteria bacterium UBA11149]HCA93253.1 DNA uptake protein [Cyanobacteria bacterium UBA9226]
MKSIWRFLSLAVATALLIVLTNCAQTVSNNTTSNPAPADTGSVTATTHQSHSSKEQININSAILSELDKLEAKLGIPALSNRIQASRPYGNIDELVSKKVITQEQFDQIKDMVTIEDIVLTGEAKDVDYATKLGLMKGHLLVAKELLDGGKPSEAEPHIGHPIEEIYLDVEEQLQERKVPEFKTRLIELQELVKSQPKDPKIATKFQGAMEAIDGAIAKLPETQLKSSGFVMKVINGLLDAANSEYGAAISNGKITAAIEYQDSRGFVIYADSLYSTIPKSTAKENTEVQSAIADSMSKLKKAWPSVQPPATPLLSPEEVSQLIKTIEGKTSTSS